MKKITSVTVIALIAASATVLSYCSKQEMNDQTGTQKQEVKMSAEDISVLNKIVAFRDKVKFAKENPGYKSGETMTSDDAVWNLETMFNVSFGFPDEQYAKTKTDSAIVQIAINSNGEVSLDDVVVKYDEIIGLVTQYYYSSGFENKGFLLLDLKQGEITNGQMEISLRSVTGEKEDEWEPFGPDDYWWYGELKGDCEWTVGYLETDAAKKIQEAVMNNKPLVSPPPGYCFIYNSYDYIGLFGDEYENETGEKLIFYIENQTGTFTWDEKCLQPDEMNFHFFGEKEVIYNILPEELNKPSNWIFMECDIDGLQEWNPQTNKQCIHHNNTLTYALRYLAPIGILEPPIEL
jgi:hypothetical protein